jgi:hypothetical protein
MKKAIPAPTAAIAILLAAVAAPAPASSQQSPLNVAPSSGESAAARAQKIRDFMASSNATAATSAEKPVLTGGDVTTKVINIGALPSAPGISFSFKAGPAGLTSAYFHFTTPFGEDLTYPWGDPSAPVSGTQSLLPIQYALLNAWSPSGMYTLTEVDLIDARGNLTSYKGEALAQRFKNQAFTVVNPNADNSLPLLLKGNIDTPSISLSSQHPVLQIDLKVADEISGVARAEIDFLGPDGETASFGGGRPPAPITGTGTLTFGANFTYETFFPTGTWTFTELKLWNYAGTFLDITDPGQIKSILGATTFQITQ